MQKKKFLITGGLGHIGSAMIREWAKRGDISQIRILDNLSAQRYVSLFNLPLNMDYRFFEGDILDREVLDRSLEGIDTVVHLAAITDAPSTIDREEETMKINYEGTLNVLDSAKRSGASKLIFASTTSVYGEAEGLVDEDYEDLRPSTPYASSKILSERAVLEEGRTGSLDTFVLRQGTIFGDSIGMRFHTVANKFAYLAAIDEPLTVWDSALNNLRPYLGLGDALRAFEFIEKRGKSGEVYNVLTDNYTIGEVVNAVRHHKPYLEVTITQSPLVNQKSYEVSDKKIKELGFFPQDNLYDSIGRTIKLFEAIKNG